MTSIYDQKTATYMYGREQYAEGRNKGKKEGMIEAFMIMVKKGLIGIAEAAKELGMSEKEFTKIAGIY